MIQAIIDIGSNTVRMAIYNIDGDNLEFIHKKKHLLGLASYLDDNVMNQAGIDRLCDILTEFKQFLKTFSIDNVVAFATAALRNCRNSQAALAEIQGRTGIAIRILSGEKEAEYAFAGATRRIDIQAGLMVDIGGGSTEMVYYRDRAIGAKISLPLGSLGLKKEFCPEVIPNKAEVEQMRKRAGEIMASAKDFPAVDSPMICGIGGTFKGTLALYNALYGKNKYNTEIDARRIGDLIGRFAVDGSLEQADALILMKNIPDRIHTIISGMVIADVIGQRFGVERIIYSDSGVREGFIYSELINN